jgi:tetratricopeptide (TPR) repeat protein
MSPRDAFIYSDLALYQAKLGQTNAAIQSVDTAMTLSPESSYILSAAAECYETLGQRDRALELLADAIDKGFPEHRIMRNPELSELLSVLNH